MKYLSIAVIVLLLTFSCKGQSEGESPNENYEKNHTETTESVADTTVATQTDPAVTD